MLEAKYIQAYVFKDLLADMYACIYVYVLNYWISGIC